MIDEWSRRKPVRDVGTPIRLADDQVWTFPEPSHLRATCHDPGYLALVRAVAGADGEEDRLQCELALAIHLLGWNYDLSSSDYWTILNQPHGDHSFGRIRREIRALADRHVAAAFAPAYEPEMAVAPALAATGSPA